MRQILRDPEQQAHFDEHGYVFHDFLDADQVERLREIYFQTAGSGTGRDTYDFASPLTYYVSCFDKNKAHRVAATEGIREAFAEALESMLIDYRIFLCNFMVKEPGGGEIEAHQDTTLVDESEHVACNLFVPLQDTTVENGCFHFIPGTHRAFDYTFRSNSMPLTLYQYNEILKPYMKPVPLPAGRGLLFDHKMFHWSPDNHTQAPRVGVQLLLIPGEAQVVLARYDSSDPDHVKLMAVPDDHSLHELNLVEPPTDLPVIGTRPYRSLPDAETLLEIVRQLSPGA